MVATDLVFNAAKSLLSSSPSIISNSTSSISETLLRKTKFDDRATTKTSLALKSYRNNGNQTSRISTLNEPQPNGGGGSGEDDEILLKDIFQWNELKTISDTINSLNSSICMAHVYLSNPMQYILPLLQIGAI